MVLLLEPTMCAALNMSGQTIWVTGLSGAGKTTISRKLVAELRRIAGNVIFLDGDELREVLSAVSEKGAHHDRDQRTAIAMQYARLCRLLSSQNMTVVIATISMFKEVHDWNREHLPGYFEIYLKVPIEELQRRDPKGIYKLYAKGQATNVAGLDLAVDEPQNPHMLIEFDAERTVDETVNEIFDKLNGRIS